MTRRLILAALALAALAVIPAFAAEPTPVDWIGTWGGVWTKTFRSFEIVIHKVDENEVLATYKWGGSSIVRDPAHQSGGEMEIKGKIFNNTTVVLELSKTITISVLKEGDGSFSVKWNEGGIPTNYAVLKKK
jgi:hypothetical protein